MKVYVFGNIDLTTDNKAITMAKKLKAVFPQVKFIEIGVNKNIPFETKETVVIMDTVEGLDATMLLEEGDLDKLVSTRSSTVHDFDLGFQLKYLKKLGKLGKILIIGIPMNKRINYLRIQSILRKLVAQDMQGS